MKQFRLPLIGSLLILMLCFSSCDKDMDINQEETTASMPILESQLITSTLEAKDFSAEQKTQGFSTLSDTLDLASIRSNFFMDEMKSVNLSIKFINSLESASKVDFLFLDDTNELKYTVHVPISSGSLEKPVSVETIVTIKEPELKIFKEATKMVYHISLVPNSEPLSPETQGKIALQSKASFLFEM